MASFPRARFIRLLVVVTSLFQSAAALGHNGEPKPGSPPPPPINVHVTKVLPPRWSWIHWWEANRQLYLDPPSQSGKGQAPATSESTTLRDQVCVQLMEAINHGTKENLIAESAIALGKLKYEPAIPALTSLINKTGSKKVRLAALVGMGLIGNESAERQLASFKPPKNEDRIAALTAVGLLPSLHADTLEKLRRSILEDDPAAATIIAWALRQQNGANNGPYYIDLLQTQASPWVASEAMLGIGQTRDPKAVRLLADFMLGLAVAENESLAWAKLYKLKLLQDVAATGRDLSTNLQSASKAIQNLDPNGSGGNVYIETGTASIKLAWLRASAAIALGELQEPEAAKALLQFLEPPPDEDIYLVMPREFALMALTNYPSDRSRDRALIMLGRKGTDNRLHLEGSADSPIRGFAALALGLYARPYDTAQGPADRPGYEDVVTALAERLEDSREEFEVRSACAVALGLTQRTAVLPVLVRTTEKTQTRNFNDVGLFGYLMLGRSLVGDQNIAALAEQFLLGRNDDTSISGVMSRRAVVLALGVQRRPTSIPILTKAWHLNYFVNKEVILALRLSGATNSAKVLLEPFQKSKDEEERAYMAEALGELLASDPPTRLARLTVGSNYTVRNDNLLPLLRLSNGFLYDYLIAAFGDTW